MSTCIIEANPVYKREVNEIFLLKTCVYLKNNCIFVEVDIQVFNNIKF